MKRPVAGREIRDAFLEFFRERRHKIVPSSPLVPENDPTLLLANAGMNQFKPYFLGTVPFPHEVPYAASCQKCFRTGDLERVGFTARHHTFFEMLGNFSFGGYFKKEAIQWAWEFVTGVLQLDPKRLVLSVYREDGEARELWKRTSGFGDERIFGLGEDSNFWTMGPTGPCGPCSEIYVDLQPEEPLPRGESDFEGDRFLEIWNLVFTQYDRREDGTLVLLPRPNIDTGMGLERIASVVQGVASNYETDLLRPLVEAVAQALGARGSSVDPKTRASLQVVADHLRAAAFLVADGVLPGNEGRGYVLRRVLRRAVRHGRLLGFEKPFFADLLPRVGGLLGDAYPELRRREETIVLVARGEEERFFETLNAGTERLRDRMESLKARGERTLPGVEAFELYDTFGFPLELTEEILKEEGLNLDRKGFEAAMEAQREKARSAWAGSEGRDLPALFAEMAARLPATRFTGYERTFDEGAVRALVRLAGGRFNEVESLSEGEEGVVVLDVTPFYAEGGGQVGDRGALEALEGVFEVRDTRSLAEGLTGHFGAVVRGRLKTGARLRARVRESERRATMRNHTATHLLQAALRRVLGPHVEQAGSYVGPDRLRFDFTHPRPLAPEELDRVEEEVNAVVLDNREVFKTRMTYAEALKRGALAFFNEKYGDEVRVVDVPGFSLELCGGTHVDRTGDIGLFRIVSESSVSSGVRRLEAVTGEGARSLFVEKERTLREIAALLKSPESHARVRLEAVLAELKAKDREIERLRERLAGNLVGELLAGKRVVKGVTLVASRADNLDAEALRRLVDSLKEQLGSGVVVLGGEKDGKVLWVVGVTKDLTGKVKAGDLVRELASRTGGGGGGRPDLAQAGGKDPTKLGKALEAVPALLEGLLP